MAGRQAVVGRYLRLLTLFSPPACASSIGAVSEALEAAAHGRKPSYHAIKARPARLLRHDYPL